MQTLGCRCILQFQFLQDFIKELSLRIISLDSVELHSSFVGALMCGIVFLAALKTEAMCAAVIV